MPHLEVGYSPFTNHLLISWDMQVGPSLIQLSVVDWKVFKLFYIREP